LGTRGFRIDGAVSAVGALGNGAVAAVWIASRTTGLPIGPDAGEPEPLGVKDVLATADELVCAAIVALLLAGAAVRWLIPSAWMLTAASLVGAILPGGHA
jgi:hypothetical protein